MIANELSSRQKARHGEYRHCDYRQRLVHEWQAQGKEWQCILLHLQVFGFELFIHHDEVDHQEDAESDCRSRSAKESHNRRQLIEGRQKSPSVDSRKLYSVVIELHKAEALDDASGIAPEPAKSNDWIDRHEDVEECEHGCSYRYQDRDRREE